MPPLISTPAGAEWIVILVLLAVPLALLAAVVWSVVWLVRRRPH